MAELIRIQKVLSDNGVLSRRKAEEAIEKGIVTVNGRKAIIGQKINPAKDLVAIGGENVALRKKTDKVYIMLHKPRGYVTTMSDELGRRCVADLVKDTPQKVYPIGRLDKNSEGLLLMTNDGDFANFVMHPSNHIAKTYRVTVRPDVTEDKLIALSSGVMVDGVKTSPAIVNVLEKENGRVVLLMTIYEGKNRQIRKMCEAVDLEVARLKRMSVGPVKLGMLQQGQWRELDAAEVIAIKNSAKKATNKE
ncbi:MAG: pseudouridine synthase, partial [Oscillospiraceae bacterium]